MTDDVAETMGDSDLLDTAKVEGGPVIEAGGIDEVLPVALIDGCSLLNGITDDELTSSELGIDRVTGSTVESTEVVGGGGVKAVPWSVDRSGVEYTSLSELSSTLDAIEVGAPADDVGTANMLFAWLGEIPPVLR